MNNQNGADGIDKNKPILVEDILKHDTAMHLHINPW